MLKWCEIEKLFFYHISGLYIDIEKYPRLFIELHLLSYDPKCGDETEENECEKYRQKKKCRMDYLQDKSECHPSEDIRMGYREDSFRPLEYISTIEKSYP